MEQADVPAATHAAEELHQRPGSLGKLEAEEDLVCLLYTSDAADERSSVDLGGRRIIKKKIERKHRGA